MRGAVGMGKGEGLVLLLLLFAAGDSISTSPPGKPVLLGCRSPEKETFSCWWLPGSDGGLPTTHRLYYDREGLTGVQECPDYESAGDNSCFFDRSHTSIWVDYSLRVVAFNALGNATSDPLKIDVMEIVKPNPPENVTVLLEMSDEIPNLHITWEPPLNTDVRSGWITLKYGLRVRQEDASKWKDYLSGKQTHFRLYSVSPGVVYTVQVRCRLDHGSWSSWSKAASTNVPSSVQRGTSFWIFVSMLFAVPFMAAMCILVMKWNLIKERILPPVPGPKIKGVDFQRFKNGQLEDFSALLLNQNFPLMVAWKDQMEDYLIVTEADDGFLAETTKNLIIPTARCIGSEAQRIGPTCSQKEREKVGTETYSKKFVSGDGPTPTEPSQPADGPRGSTLNLTASDPTGRSLLDCNNTLKPQPSGGYVDIAAHVGQMETGNSPGGRFNQRGNPSPETNTFTDVQRRTQSPSEDYSRVKDVSGDNVVFLESSHVDAACKEENYADCSRQENKKPPDAELREENSAELMDSGYIDTVPQTALMRSLSVT